MACFNDNDEEKQENLIFAEREQVNEMSAKTALSGLPLSKKKLKQNSEPARLLAALFHRESRKPHHSEQDCFSPTLSYS